MNNIPQKFPALFILGEISSQETIWPDNIDALIRFSRGNSQLGVLRPKRRPLRRTLASADRASLARPEVATTNYLKLAAQRGQRDAKKKG